MSETTDQLDGSGARFALIFGEQELAQGAVAVKPLRGDRGGSEQAVCALADLDALAARLLSR